MLFVCLEIFLARILDVSLSTFRTIFMVKKKSIVTPIIAFFEVFIWFFAARKALTTEINSIFIPICYAAGYATGTYIGAFLSEKFIKGVNSIEVTTKSNNYVLIDKLRSKGFAVSVIPLKDTRKEKKDLLVIGVNSKNTNEVIKLIKRIDSDAFIVVKDTKLVYNGYIK